MYWGLIITPTLPEPYTPPGWGREGPEPNVFHVSDPTRRAEALPYPLSGIRLVEPGIVLEVAFQGIQRSQRHDSGYALRFPRIKRIREDKKVDEIDTLENVRRLYERFRKVVA